jgi:hypothetical protein
MKVLLQSTETGLFFKSKGKWTASRGAALDFKSSVRAIDRLTSLGLERVDILLDFGEPELDLTLGLGRPKARTTPKTGV